MLTTVGFDEVSKISSRSYITKFINEEGNDVTWVNIIKHYGKYDELIEYIAQEFNKFIKEYGIPNIKKFIKNHKYITHALIKNIDMVLVRKVGNIKPSRYTVNDCIDELILIFQTNNQHNT